MGRRAAHLTDPARSGWWPGPLDDAASPPRLRLVRRRRRSADVVVAGAGISGLVAADRLARDGARVVVLEARPDRVGGRLESVDLGGVRVDLGGCWIGAAHDRTRELVAELGLETQPAFDAGERVVVRSRGRAGRATRRLTERAVERAIARFECLAPPAGEPPTWAGSHDLDRSTLADWIATYSTRVPRARLVVGDMLANVLGDDPARLSLLHALWYVRAGGGLASMVATAGGAQQDSLAGGAQGLADRLAARLGDAVELGAPVRSVERTPGGVRVLADGLDVEATGAVLALSPLLASRIAIAPEPPVARPWLRPGDAIKLVAVYEDAFWRHAGLSGMAWGDALPFSFTRDASGAAGEPGVLAVFAVGDRARRLRAMPAPERDVRIERALAECFGPRAVRPIAIAARDWTADPWSLGAYGSAAAPGQWTADPAASPGVDARIVVAGTESATDHHGYVEGAVQAGERAAAAVLAAV